MAFTMMVSTFENIPNRSKLLINDTDKRAYKSRSIEHNFNWLLTSYTLSEQEKISYLQKPAQNHWNNDEGPKLSKDTAD